MCVILEQDPTIFQNTSVPYYSLIGEKRTRTQLDVDPGDDTGLAILDNQTYMLFSGNHILPATKSSRFISSIDSMCWTRMGLVGQSSAWTALAPLRNVRMAAKIRLTRICIAFSPLARALFWCRYLKPRGSIITIPSICFLTYCFLVHFCQFGCFY